MSSGGDRDVGEPCSWNWQCGNQACGRPHATDSKECCDTGTVCSHFGFDWCSGYKAGDVCKYDCQCDPASSNGKCVNGKCGGSSSTCEFYEEVNSVTGKCQCIHEVDGKCVYGNIESATFNNNTITFTYNLVMPDTYKATLEFVSPDFRAFDSIIVTAGKGKTTSKAITFVPNVAVLFIKDNQQQTVFQSTSSCVGPVSDSCTGKAPQSPELCFDFATNPDHCGSCSTKCPVQQQCLNSQCVDGGCRGDTVDNQCFYGKINSAGAITNLTSNSFTVDLTYDVIVPDGYFYVFLVNSSSGQSAMYNSQIGTVKKTVTFTTTESNDDFTKMSLNLVMAIGQEKNGVVYQSQMFTLKCASDELDINQQCYTCKNPNLQNCYDACVNVGNDNDNCGYCGNKCTGGLCTRGMCTCPQGQQQCSNGCVDVSNNTDNCGGCGVSCGSGSCNQGTCSCDAGLTYCANTGGCVNTDNDSNNCGECAVICDGNNLCESSKCTPPMLKIDTVNVDDDSHITLNFTLKTKLSSVRYYLAFDQTIIENYLATNQTGKYSVQFNVPNARQVQIINFIMYDPDNAPFLQTQFNINPNPYPE